MELEVDFQIACHDASSIPDMSMVSAWLKQAFIDFKDAAKLCIRVVDQDEGRMLNAQFRQKDYPTNVLSFPFLAPEGLPEEALDGFLGDIVICAPVVFREAEEQGKLVLHHWAHLIIHGALHLLGYDHITEQEATIMEQLERNILANLDIPDPYFFGEDEV